MALKPPPPASLAGHAVPGLPGRLGKNPRPRSGSCGALTLGHSSYIGSRAFYFQRRALATSRLLHKNSQRHYKTGTRKSYFETDVFPEISWICNTPTYPHPQAPGPALPAPGPARWHMRRCGKHLKEQKPFVLAKYASKCYIKRSMARASNNWYYDLIRKRLSLSHGLVFTVEMICLRSLLWGVLETLHHTR